MGTFLSFEDLNPLAPSLTRPVAEIYITDLEAKAATKVPCIFQEPLDPDTYASVKSILRQAALRWHNAGEGGLETFQDSAGPFSFGGTIDRRSRGGGRLYDSEIAELRDLCQSKAEPTISRRRAATIGPR